MHGKPSTLPPPAVTKKQPDGQVTPKNKKKKVPDDYAVDLDLLSGAKLRMLMFGHDEHRWILKYRYVKGEGPVKHKPEFVNDVRLTVDYLNGIVADEMEIDMDMVFPERRGKQFKYGIDVSENSRVYAQFLYSREMHEFRLIRIELGTLKIIEGTHDIDKFVKEFNKQYPLKTTIGLDCGDFVVPFRTCDDKDSSFEFPLMLARPNRVG
jgi:hypothetical protein